MRRAILLALLTSLACSGCEREDGDVPEAYRGLAVPEARLADPEARRRGAELYGATCALCHGERGDGAGIRRTGLPRSPRSFRDPAWCAHAAPRRVFAVIRGGLPVGGMPAWPYTDDEIWDLVAYVRSLAPCA